MSILFYIIYRYIQSTYAERIISCYTKNGPYKSLNDLLIKTNINVDILNKFYDLILSHKIQKKKIKNITPDISEIEV